MQRKPETTLTRGRFIGSALAIAASASPLSALGETPVDAPLPEGKPAGFKRKIKLGLIGCGGRGSWIAKSFQQHGGYEIHAVADYFSDVANKCADALGVDKARP